MLLALSGYITGYNGEFPFDKPGDLYGEHRYVGMRTVSKLHKIITFENCNCNCRENIQPWNNGRIVYRIGTKPMIGNF